MKDLRRALKKPSYEILGRPSFGLMVGKSGASIKHYETGATPAPLDVLRRCRQIAAENSREDLVKRFDEEIAGAEKPSRSYEETIFAMAGELAEVRAMVAQILKATKPGPGREKS